MKAQVLFGINDLKYEENYRVPELRQNEVLVKVKACGICGSDLDRVFKNGTYHFPTIIGHEFSGEVVKTFNKENSKWLGKSVSIFPLIPCKKCEPCKTGYYQLCENYNYLGSRCDGGFAEYVAVPDWNLMEIPHKISYEEAAMLEPSAVALHALKKAGNLSGKKILVTGSGTISTILVQLAFACGASKVFVLARNIEKLEFIKKIVPNVEILDCNNDSIDLSVDVTIEGTGSSSLIEKSILFTKRIGTLVLMGNPSNDIILDKKIFWQILRKEINLQGTWNSSFGIDSKNDWSNIFDFILQNKLNLKQLITHRFELRDLYKGLLVMKDKKELTNKVMVTYE